MELINQIDETFKFENKKIRVLGSYNEPWFVAKDICDILGLKNVTESLKNIPIKWKTSETLRASYNSQNMNIISEPAVYKLIMRSNKEIAQKFQEVVCEEILPTLRKKGEYKIQNILDKNKELELEKLRLENEKKIKDEELIKKNKEIKKLHTLVKKKEKKRYAYSHCVYIISNPDINNHYKIGITGDRNQRLDGLAPGAPRPYNIEYSRELQNAKEEIAIESLLLGIFDKYRVETDTKGGKQREWIKNIKLDDLKNEMDNLVNYFQNRKDYFDKKYLNNEDDVQHEEDVQYEDDEEAICIGFKVCYVCHEDKPLTEYYNKIENVDGKEGSCKKCYAKYKKELKQEKDAREIITRDKGTKKCRTCFEIKEFKNFTKHGTSKDGYGYECIDCRGKKYNKVKTKRCNKCRIIKNINEYNKFRLGYNHYCIQCQNKNIDTKENENVKCCSNCKEQLSIDNFNKCKTSYDGYSNYCRKCTKQKKKEYTKKIKIKDKLDIIIKTCNECKVEKDVKYFLKKRDAKDGYSNKCKECIKQLDFSIRNSKIT